MFDECMCDGNRFKSRPLPVWPSAHPIFLIAILAAISMLQIACSSCWVTQAQDPRQRLAEALKREAASPISPPSLRCPSLNAPVVSALPPANGGHQVILSWKASLPADATHSAVVGYCVYRAATGDPLPGLINSIPFSGTTCMDDVVENKKQYSYVVRAINARGVPSPASKAASAAIPGVVSSKSSSMQASAPLCRGVTMK